jgi:polar amino acid transport system substrate-binding protein
MRKILFFLIGSLFLATAGQTGEPVRLMANTSPPYTDERLPGRGLAIELVEHIFSRTDYTPDIAIDSWSRALEGVSIGVYDALASAWYTEERSKAFLFSEPYLDSDLILLKARSLPANPRSLQDLAGARIGVRTDYGYGIDFAEIPDVTLVEEHHLIQNLLNLLSGKVHFVIGDRRTVIFQLNEYLKDQIHKFQVVDIDLPGRARHVAAGLEFSGHKELIAAFNKALAETRRDGSYDAIIRKWDERYPELK